MRNHYYTTKLVKMGKWTLYPLDTEAWMSEEGSVFFDKYFGISKGLLMIHDPLEHAYVPEDYFRKVHNRIKEITVKDPKGLEKILKRFYQAKRTIKKNLVRFSAKDYTKLTNEQLIKLFVKNREQVHHITVFDQFGWIAEEYWTRPMEEILTKKLNLTKGSDEYNRVLFAFVKPAEISTTLAERRDAFRSALAVQGGKSTIEKEARRLSRVYGWMPVFAFGESWDVKHYSEELGELIRKPRAELEAGYNELKNYRKRRSNVIKEIVKEYKVTARDIQPFIDFGLALDARNEAEYCLSFGGFYVRPMYEEIARRLGISVADLRLIYEKEIAQCLRGSADVNEILKEKRGMLAYGYDPEMKNRINFGDAEARDMFAHIESYVKNIQGSDEFKGTCASAGKANGIARIVHSPQENSKVENGNILITHATTVDYLPAMKKAAAIITEVGGLTCHAAVVSREFGIPCVVALKNAMKNFKDGEMIEVDADKGIVRKI